MRVQPINMAEAIFEPFWDNQISELASWRIEPGVEHGLAVRQSWCFVQFEWARKPAQGPALRMNREMELDCSDYTHLMASIMAPFGATCRIIANTDRGCVQLESPPAPDLKKE